ncbi:MAG: NAD-dependent epimerase/dehydratase family protein [Phycisphaerales bacterium JB039]
MATDQSAAVVTGAAGFIGSSVSLALLRAGWRIVGVDNFDPFYDESVKRANVRACAGAGDFELLEADICEPGALAGALRRARPGLVIHLAARAGVRPSIEDPVGYARANVLGTAVVLDACLRAGTDRILCASSSSVYGNSEKVPFAETDDVSRPISPYASTKASCELLGFTHHALHGQPVAMLRFFTVYGPRQRPDLAISKFMRRVAAGEPIPVFGDGSTSRDYTFIDDIVAGVRAAADAIGGHGYRVWNLGSDTPVRLDAMIEAVAATVGRAAVIDRQPMQPGDVERTWADLTRSGAELHYSPSTSFADGLRKQWEWMRGQG